MNAKSEMMLIETSSAGRKKSAPRNDTGMPIVTQNATLSSRKRPSTISTSSKPSAMFLTRSESRCS